MVFLQYLYPQKALSTLVRYMTRIKTPWFKNAFIRLFIKVFKVDFSEAKSENVEDYPHFNAFFTRELKTGLRPLAHAQFVCPVDGQIAQMGDIVHDQILQAKGHQYSVDALLADTQMADLFEQGHFATIYLSPRDYHRIHMPCAGTLTQMRHIPGKLFSVSLKTAENIPNLFARNERLVCLFDTEWGKMAMILVGAINVSSIETVWAGTITPPYAQVVHSTFYDKTVNPFEQGQEMGRFNMGSTVIILWQAQQIQFDTTLNPNQTVRLGQALSTSNPHSK